MAKNNTKNVSVNTNAKTYDYMNYKIGRKITNREITELACKAYGEEIHTMKQWAKMGYSVKKGAKACAHVYELTGFGLWEFAKSGSGKVYPKDQPMFDRNAVVPRDSQAKEVKDEKPAKTAKAEEKPEPKRPGTPKRVAGAKKDAPKKTTRKTKADLLAEIEELHAELDALKAKPATLDASEIALIVAQVLAARQ